MDNLERYQAAIPIPGYEGYKITTEGEVFNERNLLVSPYSRNGYQTVNVGKSPNRKSVDVHRLMGYAYLGLVPGSKLWVNHKDGNKANNSLSNLELDTPSHNHEHARGTLKRRYARGESSGPGKLSEEAVEAIRQLNSLGWSQHKLARAFQVCQPSISNIFTSTAWK